MNKIIEKFSEWWDSYEDKPPKSSVMRYLVRQHSNQKQEMIKMVKKQKAECKCGADFGSDCLCQLERIEFNRCKTNILKEFKKDE